MVLRAWMVPLVACWLAGCASSPLRITESGFTNEKLKYDISFQNDGPQLLPSDWRLDNFYGEEAKALTPKTSSDYITQLDLDFNGDGRADQSVDFPVYELRFEHLHSNGVISIRALVLDHYEQDKDLRLLVSDMVSSIAGGYDIRARGRYTTGGDMRFAARRVEEGPAKLAGHDAFSAVVDVSNVDQSLISAPAVTRRMKMVLVRSGLTFEPAMTDKRFPVYLCASFFEHPTSFDAHLPAFKQLLGQIRLSDRSGYEETLTPVADAIATQHSPEATPSPPAEPAASAPALTD